MLGDTVRGAVVGETCARETLTEVGLVTDEFISAPDSGGATDVTIGVDFENVLSSALDGMSTITESLYLGTLNASAEVVAAAVDFVAEETSATKTMPVVLWNEDTGGGGGAGGGCVCFIETEIGVDPEVGVSQTTEVGLVIEDVTVDVDVVLAVDVRILMFVA